MTNQTEVFSDRRACEQKFLELAKNPIFVSEIRWLLVCTIHATHSSTIHQNAEDYLNGNISKGEYLKRIEKTDSLHETQCVKNARIRMLLENNDEASHEAAARLVLDLVAEGSVSAESFFRILKEYTNPLTGFWEENI